MTTLERAQREAVVSEARSWLETPYHHLARVKGAGVDCAQLPIAVYAAAGLIPDFNPGVYAPQWFLHRDGEKYLEQVERFARCIGEYAQFSKGMILLNPGDFVVYKFGRCYAHGAIVVDWPIIIHAWRLGGKVGYGDASRGELATRPVKFYTVWGE